MIDDTALLMAFGYLVGILVCTYWTVRRFRELRQLWTSTQREVEQLTRLVSKQIKQGDEARRVIADSVERIGTSRQNVILPLEAVVRALQKTNNVALKPPREILSREERWLRGDVPTFLEPTVESLVKQAQAEISNGFEYEDNTDV